MESFYTDLLTKQFSSSVEAMSYCRKSSWRFGLIIQQDQGSEKAIHVDCFTAPSSSSHHHRRLVLCESTTHMWSFRLRPLPAYEQHQVRAQVDQLQLAEGKLLSAAAGSQVLTDLAMIELRRLLATISVQNDIMPQTVIAMPQRTVHVKLHTHRVLQGLGHQGRQQILSQLSQNATASPFFCMNSTSSSVIHDDDAVQQDPYYTG